MAMWRAPLLQTASNGAAAIVAAAIESGQLSIDEPGELEVTLGSFVTIRDHIFTALDLKAAEDDAVRDAELSAKGTDAPKSTSGRKTGGRKGSGLFNADKEFIGTLEQARELRLNSGAFQGETLGHVVTIDVNTADTQYAYGDGERDGQDYIAWLASGRNKNVSTRTAAQMVAEDLNIEVLESN